MKKQGIYKITNKINGNVYVGQSSNIEVREQYHKKDLTENKHHQKNLQKEFNELVKNEKYKNKGSIFYNYINFEYFVFDSYYDLEIIKEIHNYNKDTILDIEDYYISKYSKGYSQLTNKQIKDMFDSYKHEKEEPVKEYKEMKRICDCYKQLKFEDKENIIFVDFLKTTENLRVVDKKYYYLYALFFENFLSEKIKENDKLDFTIDDIVNFGKMLNGYCKDKELLWLTLSNGSDCILTKTNIRKELKKLSFIHYDKKIYEESDRNRIVCNFKYKEMSSFMYKYYYALKENYNIFNINTDNSIIKK